MNQAKANEILGRENAVFKQRTGSVDWYWSHSRNAWIAKSFDALGNVMLRVVESGCNC